MAAATLGIFPTESPLYGFLSRYLLPVCLAFLLVNVDLPGLASLGRPALAAMGAGVLGIMLGAVISFSIFHSSLPPESWKVVGALSGSWIGGSANMIAVKEALGAPGEALAPVIIVDTLVAYGWMALLISGAVYQHRFDAWNSASSTALISGQAPKARAGRVLPWIAAWVFCVGLGYLSVLAGKALPEIGVMKHTTWTILAVTTAGLLLSLTGLFAAAPEKMEWTGTFLLYALLVSLGAQAKLSAIFNAPLFLALGAVWMTVHGVVLFSAGRWFKSPLFLLASASQACVGGPISAPLVSAVYRPALAPVGLLLAILGNVLGTYLGLVTAHLCAWVAG